MFERITSKVRGWMQKMGLLQNVNLHNKIDSVISAEMEKSITIWKQLYNGFYKEWHECSYTTVDGNGHTRNMKSLGMPKVIASELASLVFNEKCEISLDDELTSDYVKDVLDSNSFTANFQQELEKMFALGGMGIEVYQDSEAVRLAFANAEDFIPLANNGRFVTDGVFINRYRKGNTMYIHLRIHSWTKEKYTITNELYETTDNVTLGAKVNLKTIAELADLAPVVELENVDLPFFVYLKPALANHIDLTSKVGVSVYAAALDTLHAIDTKYDSFDREFRLGKKRILVSLSATRASINTETGMPVRYFDVNDEAYEAFNFDMDNDVVKDIPTQLRVQEHIEAINAELEILSMRTGFSSGTFTFTPQGLKTATEVISENSKTYRTRRNHLTAIEEGLKHMIRSILTISTLYEFYNAPDEYDISINFDDSLSEDRDTNADYWIKLKINGIAPSSKVIEKVLKVTPEEAEDMLKKITEEEMSRLPQDINFGGE